MELLHSLLPQGPDSWRTLTRGQVGGSDGVGRGRIGVRRGHRLTFVVCATSRVAIRQSMVFSFGSQCVLLAFLTTIIFFFFALKKANKNLF